MDRTKSTASAPPSPETVSVDETGRPRRVTESRAKTSCHRSRAWRSVVVARTVASSIAAASAPSRSRAAISE